MPVDQQAEAWLAGLAGAPALNELPVADARAAYRAVVEQCGLPAEEVADITEVAVPGPHGDVPTRVYTPKGSGLFPVLIYYHGGGWVIGDPDVVHGPCTVFANRAHAVVVSVDYRKGPENPFPSAVDDSIAVLDWVRDHSAELNIDPDRIAVAGDSAGGNLAAVVALDARDRRIPLVNQILIYPAVDFDLDTESMRDNGEGYFLTLDLLKWFVERYAPDPADWRAAPMSAADVSGVAPAYIVTAEFDPLRDAGEAYAARLENSGVPVVHQRYDGQIHGFAANLAGAMDEGRVAVERIAEHLRTVFRLGWRPRLWE